MRTHFKSLVGLTLGLACLSGVAGAAGIDPHLRDEDISGTQVLVTYTKRPDNLYEYVYTLRAPLTNKSKVHTLLINLYCPSGDYGTIDLPVPTGDARYEPIIPPMLVSYTRTMPFADAGSAGFFGINKYGNASFLVGLRPGQEVTGIRLISGAAPGWRVYNLKPSWSALPGTYDYPEQFDPTIPTEQDFVVSGAVPGPGCPGYTAPVEVPRYAGTRPEKESEETNGLVVYGEPLKDQIVVPIDAQSVKFTVYYSEQIDAGSFKVEPAWLQKLFHPAPGTSETVEIPLEKKLKNDLIFRAHAQKSDDTRKDDPAHQSFMDTDRFQIRRGATN